MPTSSVAVGVDTKELLANQNGNSIKADSTTNLLENHQDMQKKKQQQQQNFSNGQSSPRRKNSGGTGRTMNGNSNGNSVSSNRRDHRGFQNKRNHNHNDTANKQQQQHMYNKQQQSTIQQPKSINGMSLNGVHQQQQQQSQHDAKKSSHKSSFHHRTTMFRNGNYQYELQSDSTSAPPSLDNDYLSRQHQQQQQSMSVNGNSPADLHSNSSAATRKYTKNFLNDIGMKLTTTTSAVSPRPTRDEMSLRMALGDNSFSYAQLGAAGYFGNQLVMQQQQQQQQYYSYQRYQTQHQLQQLRMQRNGGYKLQYDDQAQCNCPTQTQVPHERNVQYCYQSSPSYTNQNKQQRDYRYSDKNKSRQYNNQHGFHHNNNNHHHHNRGGNGFIEKSQSFNEDDARRNSRTFPTLNLENTTYRSLSPTPPSSSKSSSPGVQEKSMLEATTDDSESIASNTSSVHNFTIDQTLKSPAENISSSVPLLVSDFAAANNVSYWVSRGKLHNGHSVSAEEIHVMPRETFTFKRPGSVHGQKRVQILKHNPTTPYPEYLDIFDVHTDHCKNSEVLSVPPNLLCKSQFDTLSQAMWSKFAKFQQKTATYQKKIDIWRELHDSLRVSSATFIIVINMTNDN